MCVMCNAAQVQYDTRHTITDTEQAPCAVHVAEPRISRTTLCRLFTLLRSHLQVRNSCFLYCLTSRCSICRLTLLTVRFYLGHFRLSARKDIRPTRQGRNFGLKSGGTNSEGERGALGSWGEREENREEVSLLIYSGVWESVMSSPSGVRGRFWAENGFIVI